MSRTYRRQPTKYSCKRHTCDYCADNRTIQHRRALMAAAERALDNLMPELLRAAEVAQAQVERAEPKVTRCPSCWGEGEVTVADGLDLRGNVCGEHVEPCATCEGEGEVEEVACLICGGPAEPLGALGRRMHYRCRYCGMEQSSER